MKKTLAALLWLCAAGTAVAGPADSRVLAAREAYKAGELARLSRYAQEISRTHELAPYVEYWNLSAQIGQAARRGGELDVDDIRDFLARHKASYVAERLRGEWLKLMGKNGQWAQFDAQWPALEQPDQDLSCYNLQSRARRGEAAALDEAAVLWQTSIELPESCRPMLSQLVAAGRIRADDMWLRIRRAVEAKRPGAAKYAASWLMDDQAIDARTIDQIIDNPARYLDRLSPKFSTTRRGRELAIAAVGRLARVDAREAAKHWESIDHRFSAEERAYVAGQLGWQLALAHDPAALRWFKAAGDAPMVEEQRAWRVRAALRAGDWRFVRKSIELMPPEQQRQPDWVYWRGRALKATGHAEDAMALFERICDQPEFYGNLASDELGRPISVPPKKAPLTTEELNAAANDGGVRRALALFRLSPEAANPADVRLDGVREWNWSMQSRDDRFLLAAAEVAKRENIYDRTINAANRTVAQHDYNLRFLSPFHDRVAPRARELSLDPAWVYGLMRQESRFVSRVSSSAGAQGLMQVMPETGRWVARKIGMPAPSVSQLNDIDTNITLGTQYLRMVFDSLHNQPVLASAAYNAGPGRARKWRDSKPLEGAIYAETIPFNETRDYVKKVMSNAVYYAVLFEGKPQSLKPRLGVVPANTGELGPVSDDGPLAEAAQ